MILYNKYIKFYIINNNKSKECVTSKQRLRSNGLNHKIACNIIIYDNVFLNPKPFGLEYANHSDIGARNLTT